MSDSKHLQMETVSFGASKSNISILALNDFNKAFVPK